MKKPEQESQPVEQSIKEVKEQPQKQETSLSKSQTPKKPEVSSPPKAVSPPTTPTIPSNLDLGDYRSSSDPVIGHPPIEDRATGELGGLLDRIKSKVTGKETESGERAPRPTVKVTKGKQNEFMELARTLLSPMLILAVGQSFGEVCAPTKEEADEFVAPLARIITRHVPMPDHMSADLIDILSIVSVSVMWYSRVSSNLPWNDSGDGGKKKPPQKPMPSSDNDKAADRQVREMVIGTRLEEFMS